MGAGKDILGRRALWLQPGLFVLGTNFKEKEIRQFKKDNLGVPVMAQWLTNATGSVRM